MNKFVTLILSIICVVVPTPAPAEIRVGVILPLTGAAADYGVAIKNSILLAVDDKPTRFRGIRFEFEDTFGNDPRRAVDAFHKLKNSGVDLIYSWGVALCQALAPVAESNRMPFIGQCIAREIGYNRRYVMRFMPDSRKFMKVQADYLASKGAKKIALLVGEHSYTEELTRSLEENLPPEIKIVKIDTVPQSEMDLRPYITRLQRYNFDYLGNLLFIGQVSQFYKQSHAMHLNFKTFGNNLFESDSEIKAAQGTMDGSIFSNTAIYPEYINRYRAKFGDQNQLGFGSLAYEFAATTGRLFGEGNNLTSLEILERYHNLAPNIGEATGPYRVINDPEVGWFVDFPVVMKQIIDGQVKILK